MTFKMLLKSELKKLNCPVEISEIHSHKRIIDMNRESILQEGVKIRRLMERVYDQKYHEFIIVNTNGCIDDDKIKNIAKELLESYFLPWNVIRISVIIRDENEKLIFDAEKKFIFGAERKVIGTDIKISFSKGDE